MGIKFLKLIALLGFATTLQGCGKLKSSSMVSASTIETSGKLNQKFGPGDFLFTVNDQDYIEVSGNSMFKIVFDASSVSNAKSVRMNISVECAPPAKEWPCGYSYDSGVIFAGLKDTLEASVGLPQGADLAVYTYTIFAVAEDGSFVGRSDAQVVVHALSKKATGVMRVADMPIFVVPGQTTGYTTFSWGEVEGTSSIEIRVNSPNGPLFAAGGKSGTAELCNWATDGMVLYMQDASSGDSSITGLSENTMSTILLRVLPSNSGQMIIPPGTCLSNYLPPVPVPTPAPPPIPIPTPPPVPKASCALSESGYGANIFRTISSSIPNAKVYAHGSNSFNGVTTEISPTLIGNTDASGSFAWSPCSLGTCTSGMSFTRWYEIQSASSSCTTISMDNFIP